MDRADAERGHAEETARLQREARAAADRREGLAKLGGQVGAKASRIEAREAEVGRLRSTIEAAQARAAEAEHEFSRLEVERRPGRRGRGGARHRLRGGRRAPRGRRGRARPVEGGRGDRRARAHHGRRPGRGARPQSAAARTARQHCSPPPTRATRSSGRSPRSSRSSPGCENAVAAALGWAAEALAVGSLDAAAAALDALRDGDSGPRQPARGRDGRRTSTGRRGPALPGAARWARTSSSARRRCAPLSSRCWTAWLSCRTARLPGRSSAPIPASPP